MSSLLSTLLLISGIAIGVVCISLLVYTIMDLHIIDRNTKACNKCDYKQDSEAHKIRCRLCANYKYSIAYYEDRDRLAEVEQEVSQSNPTHAHQDGPVLNML